MLNRNNWNAYVGKSQSSKEWMVAYSMIYYAASGKVSGVDNKGNMANNV